MGFAWKDVVPSDQYCLRAKGGIGPLELVYITQLYQPLIGPLSVCLYVTLYHELTLDGKQSVYGTHRGLMSMMGSPLNQIVKARENLEAVGLLRTVKVESEEGAYHYEYWIQPPISPAHFFADDLMSIILLNRVGKLKYKSLREKLVGKEPDNLSKGIRKEMTKSFDEVFSTISPTELMVAAGSETEHFLTEMDSLYPIPTFKGLEKPDQSIKITGKDPDFAFLEASLPKSWMGNRKLSTELKEALKKLAFFYLLDDYQLSYFLNDPYILNEDNEIDIEKLRLLVKKWYEQEHQGSPVITRESPRTGAGNPNVDSQKKTMTKEDEHRNALSTLSPITLLERYQGGSKVSPADMKIVEELSQTYQLPSGVINVLLDYVMLTNNKQLPRSLIFKIATHWKRLNIKTVDEALEQAKQLHQEYKNKGNTPDKSSERKGAFPKKSSPTGKKDILPEWVIRQNSSASAPSHSPEELDDEQKRQAEELLRALGEIE